MNNNNNQNNNMNNNQMNMINNQKHNNANNNNQKTHFQRKRHVPNLENSIMCTVNQDSPSIDKNEVNAIKNIIQIAYSNFQNNNGNLSDIIIEHIKKKLGGEWFIFICDEGKDISFTVSTVSDTDFLILKLGKSIFKIAKVK